MKPLELSNRLLCAANLVPLHAKLADVGTDHGYLPVWLLLHGVIDRAIASDINLGPLERAKKTAAEYGCLEKLDFRLCPGLESIRPEEVDTVTIAGMGGEMIAGILAAAPWTREQHTNLILQPMSSIPDLRAWLTKNGYRICREYVAKEGERLYLIFQAEAGEQTLTQGECWVGVQRKEYFDPLRGEYLQDQLKRLDRAISGMEHSGSALQRLETMREIRRQVKALYAQWTVWRKG